VAGLVLARLGHLPAAGEQVEVGGWRLEVLEVDRNAIQRLRLRPADAPS
jgi:CBS domain containing-hemolysin-like protein